MHETESLYVFPVRAGMSRSAVSALVPVTCVPRASGDEPYSLPLRATSETCSPRERG